MTLIKKQSKSWLNILGYFSILIVLPNFLIIYQSLAQESYKLNEIEINRTSNLEGEGNLDLPTNPFEIVDRIRRATSMNEATKPSEAIDDALKTFDMIKDENQI